MAEAQLASEEPVPTSRETAEMLAQIQAHPDGRWMFRLWLELLLEAGRDEKMRALAVEFWRSNRELVGEDRRAKRFEEPGREPPLPPTTFASALIAMDIGLAIQHYVDPEAVPLDVYPDVFGALFDSLVALVARRAPAGSATASRRRTRPRRR